MPSFRTQPDGAFQELTSTSSFGAGINENGDVTGVLWRDGLQSEPRHAFRYSDADGVLDLGTLRGGWTGGRAINLNRLRYGKSAVHLARSKLAPQTIVLGPRGSL